MISIIEFVIGKYDPDKYCLSPPRTRSRKETSFVRLSSDDMSVNMKTGNVEKYTDLGHVSEWDVVTHQTSYGQRELVLTPLDLDKIKFYGLKRDKAEQIKPLWASGHTIAEASAMKKEAGFGVRTVAKYFKAFNEAIGGQQEG